MTMIGISIVFLMMFLRYGFKLRLPRHSRRRRYLRGHSCGSDFSLVSIRVLYDRCLSVQVFVLAILLTFIGVNSYVLSHGIRMSTLIGVSSLSLIYYSCAPSCLFSRRL